MTKVYEGIHEEISAERYRELGWADEQAQEMVKEGTTEPRVYVVEVPDHDGATGYRHLLEADEQAQAKSPGGFAWGYGGSGPTALARMILLSYTGSEPDPPTMIEFRRKFLEVLDQDDVLEIKGEQIEEFLAEFALVE